MNARRPVNNRPRNFCSEYNGINGGQQLQQNSALTLLRQHSAVAAASEVSKRLPIADHPRKAAVTMSESEHVFSKLQ